MAQVEDATEFSVGQAVEVKRHGAATITEALNNDLTSQYYGRVQVRYEDTGKTYFCRPEALRALKYPPQRVLICETTKHYRAAALSFAHPSDVVLEVGCHEGVTTALLHQRCHWVLGIDKCWDPVAVARSKHPECKLEKMDGFDIPALKALSPTGTFDKIFIDIGGIAELHVVMGLLGLYFRTFKAAYIIVKSKFMTDLMAQAQVWVPPGHQRKEQELTKPPWRPRPPAAVAQQQQQQQLRAGGGEVERQRQQQRHHPGHSSAQDEQQQTVDREGETVVQQRGGVGEAEQEQRVAQQQQQGLELKLQPAGIELER